MEPSSFPETNYMLGRADNGLGLEAQGLGGATAVDPENQFSRHVELQNQSQGCSVLHNVPGIPCVD